VQLPAKTIGLGAPSFLERVLGIGATWGGIPKWVGAARDIPIALAILSSSTLWENVAYRGLPMAVAKALVYIESATRLGNYAMARNGAVAMANALKGQPWFPHTGGDAALFGVNFGSSLANAAWKRLLVDLIFLTGDRGFVSPENIARWRAAGF